MMPRIQAAEYRTDYRIWLRFSDGVQGEIDLEDELWGEVFEPLRSKDTFAAVRLDPDIGTIVWPTGADFAPEFLYRKLNPAGFATPTR